MNVSTDACILINFLRVHRLDLLGAMPPYVFCVPPEALHEITYPEQQAELKEALDRGWIQETRLEAIAELQVFTQANEQLGAAKVPVSLWQKYGIGYSVLMTPKVRSGSK